MNGVVGNLAELYLSEFCGIFGQKYTGVRGAV
jgi:hypothetical protein